LDCIENQESEMVTIRPDFEVKNWSHSTPSASYHRSRGEL